MVIVEINHSYQNVEFSCFDIPSNDSSVCSGNGQCIGPNNCSCYHDFGGDTCNITCSNAQVEQAYITMDAIIVVKFNASVEPYSGELTCDSILGQDFLESLGDNPIC